MPYIRELPYVAQRKDNGDMTTEALTELTITEPLLREAIDAARQGGTEDHPYDQRQLGRPECGSACCIVGQAYVLDGHPGPWKWPRLPEDTSDWLRAALSVCECTVPAALAALDCLDRVGLFVPTPEQEPNAEVRRLLADRLPVERLPDVPTPAQEPDADVRWTIAERLPEERLPDIPTPEQEPDTEVRRMIAGNLPVERLPDVPTPAQEPDEYTRWTIVERLPVERLPDALTPEQEPEADVRRAIVERLPVERLPDALTPEQEPDVRVRQVVAERLSDG